MPTCKFTKKLYHTSSFMYFFIIFSQSIAITSSEDALKVCQRNFFQRKVVLLVFCMFSHDSSKPTSFMLNMAFDVLSSTVFVKEIGNLCFLQYKDYSNILLVALCFDMFLFYKKIVVYNGDNNYLF